MSASEWEGRDFKEIKVVLKYWVIALIVFDHKGRDFKENKVR